MMYNYITLCRCVPLILLLTFAALYYIIVSSHTMYIIGYNLDLIFWRALLYNIQETILKTYKINQYNTKT